ncbi:MAG TPA: tetratricopeptide repeat protein [Bryobacteraceae bacterium]|nr:tetratricopeptide repeat protein [Bryobacteraceae bacterium]
MLREHSQHSTSSGDTAGVYSRKEVCRLLHIDVRQLRSWERQQLIPSLREFRFADLFHLKRIIKLRAENVHPRRIRQALQGLRERLRDLALAGPDAEDVRLYRDGRRVRIQIGKQKMDPVSGQLVFDFNEQEINKLLQLPATQKNTEKMAQTLRNKLEADRWFERGLHLEQSGAPYEEVIEAYRKASELDPMAAGALVNMGTVFFNGHAWADAEAQYKKALAIDPQYALAHFNLGNLYDERGDVAAALRHYQAALQLFPNYADAHYNMALLYQSAGETMNAVRHWKVYLKLDSSSAWSQIARRELGKLEALTVVQGNRPKSTTR